MQYTYTHKGSSTRKSSKLIHKKKEIKIYEVFMIDIVKYIKVHTKLLLANCIWLGIDIKTKTNNNSNFQYVSFFVFLKETKFLLKPSLNSQSNSNRQIGDSAIFLFGYFDIWYLVRFHRFSSLRSETKFCLELLRVKVSKIQNK